MEKTLEQVREELQEATDKFGGLQQCARGVRRVDVCDGE